MQGICCCGAGTQNTQCQTDSEPFADNLPKLLLIESMLFLGNFCPFTQKAPTVVSVYCLMKLITEDPKEANGA